MFDPVPTAEWCAAHPLDQVSFLSSTELRRAHQLQVAAYALDLLQRFNCRFRGTTLSTADLATLAANSTLRRISEEWEDLLPTRFGADDRSLSVGEMKTDFRSGELQSILLFYANEFRIVDLSAMATGELTTRLFRLVDMVNLVFGACAYDDDEIGELGDAIGAGEVFAHLKKIMDRLFAVATGAVCPTQREEWPDRDHERKILCSFHEILYETAGVQIGWDTIETRDVNEIIRGERRLQCPLPHHHRTVNRFRKGLESAEPVDLIRLTFSPDADSAVLGLRGALLHPCAKGTAGDGTPAQHPHRCRANNARLSTETSSRRSVQLLPHLT